MKIKKNDNIIVIAGKDKGKKAKVLKVFPSVDKVLVEGVNIAKKHIKTRSSNKSGQIVEREMPIHISNVAAIDSKSGKATRVGYKVEGDKKTRIARSSGQNI